MKTSAVLFDAGGVLLCPDWYTIAAEIQARGGRADAAALSGAEGAVFARIDRTTGGTDQERWRGFVGGVLRDAGTDPGPIGWDALLAGLAEVHRTRHLWTSVPTDVLPCLTRLATHGAKLGVVSNSNGQVARILASVGLADHFSVILDSHVVGVEKPDPRIFHLGCEALGVSPAETLFVGDSVPVDCEGAIGAGLRPLLIDRSGCRVTRFERIETLDALG